MVIRGPGCDKVRNAVGEDVESGLVDAGASQTLWVSQLSESPWFSTVIVVVRGHYIVVLFGASSEADDALMITKSWTT